MSSPLADAIYDHDNIQGQSLSQQEQDHMNQLQPGEICNCPLHIPTNNTGELHKILIGFMAYSIATGLGTSGIEEDKLIPFDQAKQAIHRYTQKMVLAELKYIKNSYLTDSGRTRTIDDEIDDRITTIEKEMEKSS